MATETKALYICDFNDSYMYYLVLPKSKSIPSMYKDYYLLATFGATGGTNAWTGNVTFIPQNIAANWNHDVWKAFVIRSQYIIYYEK